MLAEHPVQFELERMARADRLLVALDFDGVLAPLVDDADAARMLPASRAAIDRLAAAPNTAVAFVSGRHLASLKTVTEFAGGSPIWLAGSHGAELLAPSGADIPAATADTTAETADIRNPAADAVVASATEAVTGLDGVHIEQKRVGFALHTRLADDDTTARAEQIVDALMRAKAPDWRRRAGHDVLEFSWRHEGKDAAIAVLREATGATSVLFAGDDVTDEDALRALSGGDLGIKVGDGETAATVRVADPAEFAELLGRLADLRA